MAAQLAPRHRHAGSSSSRACKHPAPVSVCQPSRRPHISAHASSSDRVAPASTQHHLVSQGTVLLQQASAGLLASVIAASVSLGALAPGAARAIQPQWLLADAAAEVQMQAALDEEQSLSEEIEQPDELYDFMKLYQKGFPSNASKLEAARLSVGFRRTPDGRVEIKSGENNWFAVKNDMRAAGFLLLRDNRGYCYYLPPDEAGAIAQLDLSDDVVVAQLFANGMWQQLIEPLEVEGEAGAKPSQLQLSLQDFRAVFTLVEGGQVLPEQPILDDEDNQGNQ